MRGIQGIQLSAAAVLLVTAPRCGGDDPAGKPRADSGIPTDSGFDVALDGSSWNDAGSDAADGSSAEVGADSAPAPQPGNALLRSDGSVLALYPVGAGALPTRATGFERSGDDLAVVDEVGVTLWKKNVGTGSLFGGFDYDADGVVDAGLVRSKDSGQTCGGKPMLDTWLEVVSGKDGTVTSLQQPQPAKCWTFPTATYPTEQWTGIDVLFGSKRVLSLQAYYATDGTFLEHGGTGFQKLGSYVYPSTAAYDSTYTNDKPNAWGHGTSYLANAHVANGLVLEHGGIDRAVFFTSGRVVQFAIGPQSASQLILDSPYLSGDRTDIAGRNYGLVTRDPGNPAKLALLSGTDTRTVHDDMLASKMQSDPWGQIERHVTLYDVSTGSVSDRFFSYAHDNNDGNQYEGRVVYPAGAWVKRSGPSRLAFNVYEGGHWVLHVTAPGSVADAKTFKDLFLWDISDLDGDGSDEWLLSPSRDPSEPNVPGYYFVKWRTQIARFDDATLELTVATEVSGVIPYLLGTFREPHRSTSRGALYPALVARTSTGLALLLQDPSGSVQPHPL